MTCPNGTDDAAYVLGALSPRERLDFERHLAECPECTAAVRDLAGLPGLLGRVDASVVEGADHELPALPDTLLPALSREVEHGSRARGRRTTLLAAAAVVAAVATTSVVGLALDDGPEPGAGTAGASTRVGPEPSAPVNHAMTPVGDVPVRASLALEPEAWGTRLVLDCSYSTDSVEYDLPHRVDYYLFIKHRDGREEPVGSWQSVDGTSMSMGAGTATPAEDIASVEVRAPGGLVVLRLVL